MQRLHVDRGIGGGASLAKDFRGAREELVLPRRDLGWMHIEALRQLGDGAFVSDRREGDLGLEGRGMIAARTSGNGAVLLSVSEISLGEPANPAISPVQKTGTTSKLTLPELATLVSQLPDEVLARAPLLCSWQSLFWSAAAA